MEAEGRSETEERLSQSPVDGSGRRPAAGSTLPGRACEPASCHPRRACSRRFADGRRSPGRIRQLRSEPTRNVTAGPADIRIEYANVRWLMRMSVGWGGPARAAETVTRNFVRICLYIIIVYQKKNPSLLVHFDSFLDR